MRVLYAVMGVLFLGFAGLQFNDPDPLVWLPAYLLVAALSFAAAIGRSRRWISAAICVGFSIAALLWLPALRELTAGSLSGGAMQTQADEEVRESLGLILCAVWTGVLWWRAPRSELA